MGEGEDNVTKLGVRFKAPTPPDRTVVRPHEVGRRECMHLIDMGASFIVSEKEAEVTCSLCQTKLSPVWALAQLAGRESRFHEAHKRYHEEMARLSERAKTKCQHCDRMTRISRR